MGSSWSTYAQSSKRVVLSHTTSDKDKSERAVVESTLLSTNCHCQRFSPETLPHFLKGEDESGLKRRLKSWSSRGGSSGDCEWEGRGRAVRRGLTIFHVICKIYLSVHVSIRLYSTAVTFLFSLNTLLKCLSKHFLSHWWDRIGISHTQRAEYNRIWKQRT